MRLVSFSAPVRQRLPTGLSLPPLSRPSVQRDSSNTCDCIECHSCPPAQPNQTLPRSARPPSPFRGRAPTLYLYPGLPALPGLCLSQCSPLSPPISPVPCPSLCVSPACTCTIIKSTHRLGPCCTSPPPTTTTNHTLAVPTTTRCCCTLYHQLYHPLPVPCSGPVAQPPPSLPPSGSALLVLLLR
ncbi:hypothetical protein VTO73DRAFT_2164 [Trametes versicolor]